MVLRQVHGRWSFRALNLKSMLLVQGNSSVLPGGSSKHHPRISVIFRSNMVQSVLQRVANATSLHTKEKGQVIQKPFWQINENYNSHFA